MRERRLPPSRPERRAAVAQRPATADVTLDAGARGLVRARPAAVRHARGRARPALAGRGDRDLAARRVLAGGAAGGRDDARGGRARRRPAPAGGDRRPARARLHARPDRGAQAREAALVAVPAAALGHRGRRARGRRARRPTCSAALNELGPGLGARGCRCSPCLAAVVALVAAAATWPAWRAARRPPAEILRGGDLAGRRRRAPRRRRSARARRPLRARAARALAAPRWPRSPSARAWSSLMLALASLLERLRDDPGTVGKRYQLDGARSTRSRLPEVREAARRGATPRRATRSTPPTRSGSAQPVRLVALSRRPHAASRRRRSPSGRRLRARRRGRGRARAWPTRSGCGPGSTLAAQLPGGDEVRFRVAGVVRALENDGRIAWVRAGPAARAPTRALTPQVVVRLAAGADRATRRAPARARSARRPAPVGAARHDNARFLAVLAAVLRGVGLAVGLVCLYALVQALAITARERRGAVALLRAVRRRRRRPSRSCSPARRSPSRCPPRSPACRARARGARPARRLARRGLRRRSRSRRRAGQVAARRRRPARAGRRGDRARRAARAARADRRRAAGGVMRAALAACLAARCLASPAAAAVTAAPARRPARRCSATLVDRDGDGLLERGPGEPLRDRGELGGAGRPVATLATFAQLTDTHVRDEESPARVPFLDRLGGRFTLDVPPAGGVLHAGARRGRPRRSTATARRPCSSPATSSTTRRRTSSTQAIASLDGGARRTRTPARPATTACRTPTTRTPSTTAPTTTRRATPGCSTPRSGRFTAARARRALVPGARQPRPARPGRGAADARDRGRRDRRPRWSTALDPRVRPAAEHRRRRRRSPALLRGGLPGRTREGARRPRPPAPQPVPRRCRRPRPRTAATRRPARLRRSTSARSCAGIVLDTVDRAGGVARPRDAGPGRVAARRAAPGRPAAT